MQAININEKLSKFNKNSHPHQIATVDGMQELLANLKAAFVWLTHDDELFQVIKGTRYSQFKNRTETVQEGKISIVPNGVAHNPYTKHEEDVYVLLFEKLSTSHIAQVKHEKNTNPLS